MTTDEKNKFTGYIVDNIETGVLDNAYVAVRFTIASNPLSDRSPAQHSFFLYRELAELLAERLIHLAEDLQSIVDLARDNAPPEI